MHKNNPATRFIGILLLLGSFVFASPLLAAEQQSDDKGSALSQSLEDIEKQQTTIEDLKARIGRSEGLSKTAYELRYEKSLDKLLQQNLEFAESVAALEQGELRNQFQPRAVVALTSQFDLAPYAVRQHSRQVVIPEEGMSPAEQAAAYARIYQTVAEMNRIYELWFKSLELARSFELDIAEQEQALKEIFIERAANISVMLEHAMTDVTVLRASAAAVPDDADLKSRLKIAVSHVQSVADNFAVVLAMMEPLELDIQDYQEQLLNATGQITTDVFEVGVITNLFIGWGSTLWNLVIEEGPNLVFKLLLIVLIFVGFRKLADFIQPLLESAVKRSHLDLSELLQRMVVSIVRNIIIILGLLIALSQIGISLGPLLAGLGVVGFIVGFALQDTLSNFAAGMMILIYRPFDVGDRIDAGGVSGKVSHMSLVNTTIMTLDNQTIIVPNSKIWGDVIRNVTAQTIRRVDMTFGIAYSDDIAKTERVLREVVEAHDKVLDEPELMIRLHELGDSSVNFIVRPWVESDDYWDVYWDITRAVKLRFDEEGISIPFPQRDVHLYAENT